MSLLPIFTLKNKKTPKWFKYIIILISCLISLYYIEYISYIISFFKTINLNWLRIITFLISWFYILYNLLTILILIRYSRKDDNKIIIPNYLPTIIRKHLTNLKRISKYESLKAFIETYVIAAIYMLNLSFFLFIISSIVINYKF
jgi:hypothetical protein